MEAHRKLDVFKEIMFRSDGSLKFVMEVIFENTKQGDLTIECIL
jgi:hypothetical protein